MTKVLFGILMILSLTIPASALEIEAPEVPASGLSRMPRETDSFADALVELMQTSIKQIQPELEEAVTLCSGILCAALLFSVLPVFTESITAAVSMAGATTMAVMLLRPTDAMIRCAADAVWEICEYGKLLCPVLTTALAAQGGVTASAALYTGTTAFNALLGALVSRWMIPMVYIFLLFSTANCALGAEILKKFSDAVKSILQWLLKTLLMVFTTYISITGVVSGITDAAALKATKVMVSTAVPVVGGILSDASEAMLVSMAVMKNAAGIYGILAVLAVFVGPFIKVGVQYLLLKASAAVCSLFAGKNISALVEDFSSAMGLLLAMVAVSCMLILISTVCFLKGLG